MFFISLEQTQTLKTEFQSLKLASAKQQDVILKLKSEQKRLTSENQQWKQHYRGIRTELLDNEYANSVTGKSDAQRQNCNLKAVGDRTNERIYLKAEVERLRLAFWSLFVIYIRVP